MEEGVLIELAGTGEKKINGIYRKKEEEEDSDSTPQTEGRGVGGEDEKKDGSKDVESRLSLTAGRLLVTASHLQAYPDLLFFGKAQIA